MHVYIYIYILQALTGQSTNLLTVSGDGEDEKEKKQ